MRGVWLWVRSDLWRRRLQLLASVLLIGIGGAAVLTAAAGARRTASVITRSARATNASDLFAGPDIPGNAPAAWSRVDALPEVAQIATIKGLISAPLDRSGQLDTRWFGPQFASLDSKLLHEIDRPRVRSGRLPDPNVESEIAVNDALARLVGVTAGSHVDLRVFTEAELGQGRNAGPPGRPFPVTVTGVLLPRSDAIRDRSDPGLAPTVFFGPAAAKTLTKYLGGFDAKVVRLKRGAADLRSFERHVRELMPGTPFVFQERPTTDARARRSERPYVLALALFAILGAVAAAAVIGQLIGRQQRPSTTDRTALHAIGFDIKNFATVGLLEGALVGSAGAFLAVLGAVLASSLMPIGPVRRIEPRAGVAIDWVVLLLGMVLIVGLIALRSAVAAARVPKRRSRVRRSVAPDALARAGVAVPVVSGVRLATDGGGESSVPVRSTTLGIAVALGAVIAALVYSAGLTQFTSTPRLYGWNWDAMVAPQTDAPALIAKLQALPADPRVAAAAIASYANVEINRTTVAAVGFDAPPELTIVNGHAPHRPDEVVLGATSQRLTHADIGDWITMHGTTGSHRYRLVGQAVFPRLAPYPAAEPTGLGVGAGFTSGGLERLSGPQDPSWLLIRFRPDAQGNRPTVQSLDQELFHGNQARGAVLGPQRPNDAASYEHLTRTPLFLALLLIALAIGSAAHLLITSVRRHRRDLALLKTLGFTRRQVGGAVLAQASTLIGVALIVAVPVGAISGRWLWATTANSLGIPVSQPFPFADIALVVIGAFAVGNLLAFVPGRLAARIRPAVGLRSE